MQLKLQEITKRVGAEPWLYSVDLAPRPGEVTVLLGATRAGKTTLLRLMAGLDTPTSGQLWVDNENVTGVSVRRRNVSMVYQQFINYPSMTVAENIGAPLKLRGEKQVAQRVREIAEKLHIAQHLASYPSTLSGGEQQRVALARALAKRAPLMLLDEPLANLDYKLREELRGELAHLFSSGESTVVYATTEPAEALLLGGYTAVIDAGELLQYGPTTEIFHRPKSLREARAFSDPPMNLYQADIQEHILRMSGELSIPMPAHTAPPGAVVVGFRASALRLNAQPGDIGLEGTVVLSEITGSVSFLHLRTPMGNLVAQLNGVHTHRMGTEVTVYLSPQHLYIFGTNSQLLSAPVRNP
ncbi:MAG: ABC transporter ATP-binding protein [Pseudomonadota bacterium]|jgi:glycerol transport system ATP-binding protein